jgi:hypothetical protein
MFLSIDNPVYNTIIVFSVIMLLVYITKPDVVYDNEKNIFRQFGTTDGKTLLPIYVVGMLLAIILYVFFHYLSLRYQESIPVNIRYQDSIPVNKRKTKMIEIISSPCDNYVNDHRATNNENFTDKYQYYLQQQQIQHLQNQMNQIVQQQYNIIHTGTKHTGNQILPNNLNI